MQTAAQRKTMTLAEIGNLLSAEVYCGENLAVQVQQVVAADLMSDVLALSKPGMLLLTGLINTQVIRTALVAGLCGVVFVRGKRPDDSVLALARERGIPLLGTRHHMFEAAGLLYAAMGRR
jgi:predicted transcriptional regulator